MKKHLIAITGGIGSGKTVVSDVLRVMGHPVYDCDKNAKSLMDSSDEIKSSLIKYFGSEIINDKGIDRRLLSELVFGDASLLQILNSIVHPVVVKDVMDWRNRQDCDVAFVETAILKESGLAKIVDGVWVVEAHEDVRVGRVMRRNAFSEAEVRARIAVQSNDFEYSGLPVYYIDNNGEKPILPQISSLLSLF